MAGSLDMDAFQLARFIHLIENNGMSEQKCWHWLGDVNSQGYGRFSLRNKHTLAHRVSFNLFIGKIPIGLNICHTCDNPICVNPHHLWVGSQSENLKDAVQKGRNYTPDTKAHRNGNTSLTWQKVRAIRGMDEEGSPKFMIAKIFGVSQSTVGNIVRNETWKETTDAK